MLMVNPNNWLGVGGRRQQLPSGQSGTGGPWDWDYVHPELTRAVAVAGRRRRASRVGHRLLWDMGTQTVSEAKGRGEVKHG